MTASIQALGWTLLHFLWQGALLAAIIALALWTLEGRDSRLRYAVACGGLLLMMAAPPITFLRVQEQAQPLRLTPRQSTSASATIPMARKANRVPRSDWPGLVNRILPWLALLWTCGSLAMALRLTGGWVLLQWARRHPDTLPAPDAEQLLLLRLCQQMKVGSNLRLLVCRSVPGPTVMGWLRPVILVPPAMLTGLSPQQLELILAHELAHVLRHDYLVNLLQSIAEVLLFFHPAVWWVSQKIRQEREQASDDLAVRFQGDALDYAQALTALEALASRMHPSHSAPRLAIQAQGGDFMSRIHRIISPTAPTQLAPRAGLVVLLLLGVTFALQARTKVAPVISEQESPLPKGTVHLRRYDKDSPDGKIKAGTVDLRAQSTPVATLERAFTTIQKLPADTTIGYVDQEVFVDPGETGGLYTFKFTAVHPAVVLSIIRGYSALAPIERKPGLLIIQRMNSFTYQAALLPKGLLVNVWAGDVPADMVLEALNELEAMQPKAGIPQEVRREIPLGTGNSPSIRMDITDGEPLEVREMLENVISKPKS